jgi:hypothetical protein
MLKNSKKNSEKCFFVKETKRIWWNIFENIYIDCWNGVLKIIYLIGIALVSKDVVFRFIKESIVA